MDPVQVIFVICVIVGVIILLSRVGSGKSGSKPKSAPPAAADAPPRPATPAHTAPVHAAAQPKPAPASTPSVFLYTSSGRFWRCPNCECENSLSSTHCSVCFWDRNVGVS